MGWGLLSKELRTLMGEGITALERLGEARLDVGNV